MTGEVVVESGILNGARLRGSLADVHGLTTRFESPCRHLFKSEGPVRYVGRKAIVEVDQGIVEVDQGIVDFYRSLIPKSHCVRPQKYPAHISFVRKESPPSADAWGKYEGEVVEFLYDVDTRHSDNYYWLNAFCVRLEEIRAELGLPIDERYTPPPPGFRKTFHITLANIK